jgi:hypothetical protein
MAGATIVAIPAEDDPVWKYSSEKVPHMTLLFLGDDEIASDKLADIIGFTQHAATTIHRFGMDVDRRGELGPENADVLFFNRGYDWKTLSVFRYALLSNRNIYEAYHSVEQFATWVPHLTMGFPESPAKKDDREYPGFRWVNFDRIAVWTENYAGPEFVLDENRGLDVAMSNFERAGAEYLKHYGVPGMKWGKRRARIRSARSADSQAVLDIRAKKRDTKITSLSNKELQDAITRFNLEKQYKQLDPTITRKGGQFVKGLIGAGKTANEVVAFNNSPAGRSIREKFNSN